MTSLGAFGQKINCNKINAIVIKRVPFEIMTAVDVPCDDFEKAFSDKLEIIILRDSLAINKCIYLLSNLELRDSTIYPNIDTRAKIEIYSPKDTLTICLNQFLTIKEGVKYKTSKDLINFVVSVK
ncbi:hypothetical protein BSYN_22450 [Bacteroides sedimenti]|uniref:Uncharacterized protein n=2 Tax=Bacteroides sedimenti TaxID=2136147 RepID=A0ABN6Z644_9BACE